MEAGTATEQLRQEVEALDWYHTLELAPGVVTPGWLDTRRVAGSMPLPTSLTGKRCLDVGTFDGFWAFEMERRGATEVLAIDVLDPMAWDWPVGSDSNTIETISRRRPGAGFEIAKREFGSSVERLDLSVYDLSPADVGEFDQIYLGSLLIHLRDPIGALERVRSVCRGKLLVCDAVDVARTRLFPRLPVATLDGLGRPWWWKPNLAGLVRMVEAAGFELLGPPQRLLVPTGRGHPPGRFRPRELVKRAGREGTFRAWRGDPHAAIVARPAA